MIDVKRVIVSNSVLLYSSRIANKKAEFLREQMIRFRSTTSPMLHLQWMQAI
jgi:hypothetical protein